MARSTRITDLFIRLRSKTDGAYLAPPELKGRIVQDATDQGTNANAVAVAVLARVYNVDAQDWAGDGRRTRPGKPSEDEDVTVIGMPAKLRLALVVAAERSGRRTPQKEATFALSAHYGLGVPAPPVRRRRARRPAAAA